MKRIIYVIFLIFVLVIIVPLIILNVSKVQEVPIKHETLKYKNIINVYVKDKNEVIPMELDEYVKGVVAAEMPAEFEIEALKAQAVAARTYTLIKSLKTQLNLDEEHKGGDICTNYAHCQAYKSKEELKEIWGILSYIRYWDKISKAVDSTKGIVIMYNGELINPLFHSTSGGRTENSEDVFIESLPYLRSVVSLGEENSPKFYAKTVITFKEFKEKLVSVYPDLILNSNDIKNIKIVQQSEGKRVKSIQIGNKVFDGKQIRSLLSLNSTNFKIYLNQNNVLIETIGYGHGVGMSQFGANYMAKQGKNYNDILTYYYIGTDIVDVLS